MKVIIRLYADLKEFAPRETKSGAGFSWDIPPGTCVGNLLGLLGIPPNRAKVAYVNGIRREEDFSLDEADEVGIFPPVGGG